MRPSLARDSRASLESKRLLWGGGLDPTSDASASAAAAAAEAAVPRLPPPLQRPRRFVELVVLG